MSPLLRTAFCVLALIASGVRAEEPTRLAIPPNATEVRQLAVPGGRGFQTSYILRAKYPATVVLDHYVHVLRAPWMHCDWIPNWESFLDSTTKPPRTVHQQLHVWLDSRRNRTLTLATQYYSSPQASREPDNDQQRVVLIEHFGQDLKQVANELKLRCPKHAL
jgi:hypothetical protein